MKLKHLFLAATAILATACSEKNNDVMYWPEPDAPDTKPDTPETVEKARFVWIDAGGNFERFANSKENILADLKKVKECGFTDIVVDVRPTTGDVLFDKTTTAHPLEKLAVWTSAGYAWVDRTASFDYLQTFIDYGHELGLNVYASINTFVGGYKCPYGLGTIGMLYRDEDRAGWATVINTADGFKSTLDPSIDDYGARFLNPANDDAQAYIIGILKDIAAYDVDGILLDRCRYSDAGLQTDFSDISREKFETYAGVSLANYPEDIIAKGGSKLGDGKQYMKQWLAFRAKTIHDFVVKAGDAVHGVNPDIKFGAYVGAWYSTYYESGVNWAHPDYNPAADGFTSWANADYRNYGYADHCDIMLIGAYASADRIYGTGEWSSQGFCTLAGKYLKNVPYAGGPDVGNSTGWVDGNRAADIPKVIDACINASSAGMFIFDLCHVRKFDYWNACRTGIDNYLDSLEK